MVRSAVRLRPRLTSVTRALDCALGDALGLGADCLLASEDGRLQPANARATRRLRPIDTVFMGGLRRSRQLELLARMDEIGILDHVPVRLEDRTPLVGVA